MSHIDPFKPVTLSHPSTPLSISLLPYGLTVHSIKLRAEGGLEEEHDIQPNYEDPSDHAHPTRAFFAPIIGRYANRLPVGKLPIPGKDGSVGGHVETEEFSAPGVALHGGPYPSASTPEDAPIIPQVPEGQVKVQAGPFDRLVWTPIPRSSSQLFAKDGKPLASKDIAGEILAEQFFAIESPHGDQGYPGKLRVEVWFALSSGSSSSSSSGKSAGAIHLNYRAKLLSPESECKATPFNITHHWGFNLTASSASAEALKEGGKIDEHVMRYMPPTSNSIRLLGLDEKALPTGKLEQIGKSTPHDFSLNGGKKFGENMPAGGYDHYYFWGPPTTLAEDRVEVKAAATGLRLTFKTNQTGVQCYTTNGQPAYPADRKATGGARKVLHRRPEGPEKEAGGQGYGNHERCCVMLEFGSPHATFLHDELIKANGAGGDTVLRTGEVYDHVVVMEAWVDQKV